MTANTNLERRVAGHYASEPPLRAPDRVLQAALATIETTPQRRGLLAPWRFTYMNAYTKVAAAAVVLIVVGGLALWRLGPTGSGGLTASPSPAVSPSPAPTATRGPGPSPYVPAALTETFTSDLHGISLSYPAGWTAQAATEPWTTTGFLNFGDPAGDFLSDPALADHLFVNVASQPLGGTPFEQWSTDFLAGEGCEAGGPVVIDGVEGVRGGDCEMAFVSSGGRGYVIVLYTSGDDVELREFNSAALLDDILATIQLSPEDAVDEAPTASP